jgi:FdhD protein
LFQGTTMVSSAEDVGRHNTLDKVRGDCLLRGLDTRGGILLSTGRISSEMLNKAAKMGCPVVASRTSPTSLSVSLARAWNITLVGYLRRGKLLVYANGWRLGLDEAENT